MHSYSLRYLLGVGLVLAMVSPAQDKPDLTTPAILKVVNTTSVEELKGAGLDEETADSIFRFRLGEDEKGGTEDDRRFSTLEDLTDLKTVNAETLKKLLSCAEKAGYFCETGEEPFFTESACQGEAMTEEEAMRLIPLPETTTRKLGEFEIKIRRRFCYRVSGCRPWNIVTDRAYFAGFSEYFDPTSSQKPRYYTGPVSTGGSATKYIPEYKLSAELFHGAIEMQMHSDLPVLVLTGTEKVKLPWFFTSREEPIAARLQARHYFSKKAEKDVARVRKGTYFLMPETPRGEDTHIGGIHLDRKPRRLFEIDRKLVTHTCARFYSTWQENQIDSWKNNIYWEYQAVALGKIKPH